MEVVSDGGPRALGGFPFNAELLVIFKPVVILACHVADVP